MVDGLEPQMCELSLLGQCLPLLEEESPVGQLTGFLYAATFDFDGRQRVAQLFQTLHGLGPVLLHLLAPFRTVQVSALRYTQKSSGKSRNGSNTF